MNSNLRISLKVLAVTALLLGANLAQNAIEERPSSAYKPFCNQEIQQSLGMQGYKYPRKISLDMCPTITQSCCTVEDQLTIYKAWVMDKEEENLEERLAFHKTIYWEFLKKANEASARAKSTFELVEERAVSNCKILARRIMHYRIDAVMKLLRDQIDNMHTFIHDSYKGFYCNSCDATQSKYFRINKKRFILSEEYCRDIVNNSLVTLLYFHHHFVKYINLMSKFITQCDYMGNFKKKSLPESVTFYSKATHYRTLHGCNQYRNDINWIDFCMPVCKQFKISEFSDFFKPNADKIRKYTRWLGKQLVKVNAAEAKDLMIKGHRKQVRLSKKKKIQKMLERGEDISAIENASKVRILSTTTGSSSTSSPTSPANTSNNNNNAQKKPDENAEEEDEETKKEKDDIIMEEQQKFEDALSDAIMPIERPSVFATVKNSEIPYNSFKNLIEIKGLNPAITGKVSQFNDGVYKALKEQINLKNKGFFSKNKDDDEDDSIAIYSLGVVGLMLVLLR